MQSFGGMPSMASNIFSAYASVAASMMLFRSMANDVVPEPVKSFFYSLFSRFFKQYFDRFFTKPSTQLTMVVDEQSGISPNEIYGAAEIYLRTKINPAADRLKANKSSKHKKIILSMEKGHEVSDNFNGFDLKWQFVLIEPDGDSRKYRSEKRYFELTFDKQNKEAVVGEYLPFVLAKAKEIKEKDRAVKLYTRDCPFTDDDDEGGNGGGGYWGCINLDHPVTFDKLAMEPALKNGIIEDLDRFVRRKDYYRKVGKAWKRGYLLYGPPGTGKSSLIAAMANYLKFDVYDLELSSLYSNSELRRILLCTSNKSILVIEDIDCTAQMHDRERDRDNTDSDHEDSVGTKLTLSGLLNFIDGLWSTCGDERIVVFTTNHKEKLDPALLRPGRMDMHIHMGYCTPQGFDVLAMNYLGVSDYPVLFGEIKELIGEVDVTPAEIAEHLMRNEDVDLALRGVVDLLKKKKCDVAAAADEAAAVVEESGGSKIGGGGDEKLDKEKKKFGRFVKRLLKFRRELREESKTKMLLM